MKFYEITIKAFIHLRSTENGGRKGYILSGYRPNFLFEENINCDGSISFDKENMMPGEKGYVTVRLFSSRPIVTPYIHAAFVCREGEHIVGSGSVTANFSRKKEKVSELVNTF